MPCDVWLCSVALYRNLVVGVHRYVIVMDRSLTAGVYMTAWPDCLHKCLDGNFEPGGRGARVYADSQHDACSTKSRTAVRRNTISWLLFTADLLQLIKDIYVGHR